MNETFSSTRQLPDLDLSAPHRLHVLPDGRDLAYIDCGDRGGFPVFYFHGTPSSRLEAAFAHTAASKTGFRLISTDRPGYGHSTFQQGRTFLDWPKDITSLADALEFETFGVAGHSGAGPHLFACGAAMDNTRLKFIGALGPWGPMVAPEIAKRMNALDRFAAKLSHRAPWIMQAAFAPMGWTLRHWPWAFFKIMEHAVSQADRSVLKDAAVRDLFLKVEQEAFRQGSQGPSHEATICFGAWDFNIADVSVPTYIWLGAEDIFVSQEMARHLEAQIPEVQLNIVPHKGHFNVENWIDIFSACAQHQA